DRSSPRRWPPEEASETEAKLLAPYASASRRRPGAMSGLGGLNRSPHGVVIGMVQLQLPTVVTPAGLSAQTRKIVAMVTKAKKGMPSLDLVVFPEYALHGLSMDTNPAIMSRIDGPEVAAFKEACAREKVWGCFSIMEQNPDGNPYNVGIPVCDGPNGSKLALIICHDGMFPEMARECAYKGADIMLRTAGYTGPIRHAWRTTNQANAFCNLMVTASVCMCGSDGVFNSMGEGMIVNFDGTPIVMGSGIADEIITAEVRPDLVAEARKGWGVENNIYQFGHRGFVAVKGGAQDCPYTYMTALAAGKYRLPWEREVQVTDGTSCGFPVPTRVYGGSQGR